MTNGDNFVTRDGRCRFGPFTFDFRIDELRREGAVVKLSPQPSRVLARLLARPGEVVLREELRDHLWGHDTFVDFERGLNFCILQVRTALGDSSDNPRFVQTVPRKGYRFIAPVVPIAVAPAHPPNPSHLQHPKHPSTAPHLSHPKHPRHPKHPTTAPHLSHPSHPLHLSHPFCGSLARPSSWLRFYGLRTDLIDPPPLHKRIESAWRCFLSSISPAIRAQATLPTASPTT